VVTSARILAAGKLHNCSRAAPLEWKHPAAFPAQGRGSFDDDRGRLEGTVDAIWRQLGAGGPLLYRYTPGQDGLPGGEGAFLPCSFWLLEALLRLGRVEEGLSLFEQTLALANEFLLLPEEIDPGTGAYLGNYPLALSQAGLVHAVLEVQKALGARS
jgi:GH15 family glucan-1,4-alpha-glucosidase